MPVNDEGPETTPARCKYCRAGIMLEKAGWHTLEYITGYPAHQVFCHELLERAAEDMEKSPAPTRKMGE